MWEYRWVEALADNGPSDELSRLGADGWEAVSMTSIGVHFGETWVRILMKRPAHARVVDLNSAHERAVAS